MKKLFLIVGCLLTAVIVYAQQKYELTVKEAVDLAFKNVVELKNAQLDYQMQKEKNKEIEGQAYPQVTGAISANHYLQLPSILFPQSDQPFYNVLIREGLLPSTAQAPPPSSAKFSFQQPWNLNLGATLTQLLFQPDVFVGLQARKTALDYSQSLVDQTKEKIKDSAYKRYYAILIAEKQLIFLNESVQRLEKLYHDDSIMFKNGFAERLDMDKVEVQLNNLKSTRNIVESAVHLAYGALKFAIGVSQKDEVALKEDLTTASLKENLLDENFNYESRPEIRTLGHLKHLQELDLKRYKLGFIPTVAAVGNYSVTGMGQKFFTDKSTTWFNSSFVGININVPIFDGFQRRHKINESRLSIEKVNNTISLVKQGIDFEQFATKEELTAALLNLDAQERNMQLAARVYNATKLKFEQGVGSSFEVLQADADLQQAQSSYFNALYNATVARISYLYSLGKLQ
jgi:outer membrane protein TolC